MEHCDRPMIDFLRRAAAGVTLGWVMLLAGFPALHACNVPVFRYALERWVSDNYVMVIAHNAPLTPKQKETIGQLTEISADNNGLANLTVQVVDLAATPDDPAVEHLPLDQVTLPAAFLFYPASFGVPTLVWQSPLTGDAIQGLTRSPVREDFLERVTRGSTAVWLLLESGDHEADDRAEQVLRGSLAAAEKELVLPDGVVHPSGAITGSDAATKDNGYFDPENQLESGIPLKIDFEVIRMTGDNPNEDVLRGILLHSAPDLIGKRAEPMVFPIFGRGRILPPLIGGQIENENIGAIADYLCGACSCQIKAQNPGVDLLSEVDWDAKLAGVSAVPERELPPLSGTGALTNEHPATAVPPVASAGVNVVWRNVGLAAAAVLCLLIGLTIKIANRNS